MLQINDVPSYLLTREDFINRGDKLTATGRLYAHSVEAVYLYYTGGEVFAVSPESIVFYARTVNSIPDVYLISSNWLKTIDLLVGGNE